MSVPTQPVSPRSCWSIGSADGGYQRILDMEKYLDGKGVRYESFHTDGGHNMVNGRKFMGITIARFFK